MSRSTATGAGVEADSGRVEAEEMVLTSMGWGGSRWQKEFGDFFKPATEYANRVAPLPTIQSVQAGFWGAIFAAIVIMVFEMVADISPTQSNKGTFIVIPLCFVVPYFYIESRWRRHFKILTEEQHRLHEEAGKSPETCSTS